MFRGVYLTILPCNPDNTARDPIQLVTGTGQDISGLSEPAIEPSETDENGSNWKSTAYSTIKLAVNPVKESADVVPPLKSVIGGLAVILNHCDVRCISRSTLPTILTALLANSRVSQNDRNFDASSRRVGTIADTGDKDTWDQ